MTEPPRRDTLSLGLTTAAGLGQVPGWALQELAQGGVDGAVPDLPANFVTGATDGSRRNLDTRKVDGMITPADQFFYIQHYDRPEVDKATFRLKLTGLVTKPVELTLADLQSMR